VTEIVDLLMSRTVKQLSDQGIGLELTPAARAHLAEKGYDPQLGARPLRRAIQQLVEDPLSERILWKEFRVGETIVVDVEESPIDGEGPQLSFTAIEGIQPPPLELAGAGADAE
jgi:ATP-dependent Clp protease ATP-binding subunit ClpC